MYRRKKADVLSAQIELHCAPRPSATYSGYSAPPVSCPWTGLARVDGTPEALSQIRCFHNATISRHYFLVRPIHIVWTAIVADI